MDIQYKTCACCKQALNIAMFGRDKSRADKLAAYCLQCKRIKNTIWRDNNPVIARKSFKQWRANNLIFAREKSKNWLKSNPEKACTIAAQRRAAKLERIPLYAVSPKHQALIKRVYAEAQARGWHVDHVIPLQGELVSGLHCWANLQLLAPGENMSKGNKFEPTDI